MSEQAQTLAMLRLVACQGRGRLRRMGQRFLLPRRFILSLLALLLAVAWLGNAVMTVWLRESATPELLRALIGLGLAFYAIWHLAMAACFRPQQCLEWIESERELLEACPLRPCELLTYKLASIATTTILKASVLILLLLPDLKCVPLALAGILLGMFFLELWRMGVEIAAWGMSNRSFIAFRIVVITVLGGFSVVVGVMLLHSPLLQGEIHVGQGVMNQLGQLLVEMSASAVGKVQILFSPFVSMICAKEMTPDSLLSSGLALAMVAFAGGLVFRLFAIMPQRKAHREKVDYQRNQWQQNQGESNRGAGSPLCENSGTVAQRWLGAYQQKIPASFLLKGPVGAIAWRQWLGSRRYAGSLLTALVIPGVMAMTPMVVVADPLGAFLATAGALAFYTFLLLPTALRFDFRRDLDRMAMFKSMPIPPSAMTLGQLATPVLISTLFQATVLAVAALIHEQTFLLYLGTLLVLLPVNVLVFALDNLIFILYPYRIGQEGLEIFLRTMLTFTGKGLLFVLGLAMISVWGYGAALVARTLSSQFGVAHLGYTIFLAGLLVGTCLISWALVVALWHAYERLNPVEDIPR
ncbi:MAG: hypothetical protein ABGX16_21315 [Pirellulales bacterium]